MNFSFRSFTSTLRLAHYPFPKTSLARIKDQNQRGA